jgi:hypothetical protein
MSATWRWYERQLDDYIAISYTWGAPSANEAMVEIPLIDIREAEVGEYICPVFGGEPTKYLTVTKTMWKMIKAVGLPDEGDPPLRAI